MFCFKCGLVGHNEENCVSNSPLSYRNSEGQTNPRGAWLRSKAYGRRLLDKKEKVFSNNPLKSLSGKQCSPIPKGLIEKMANLKMLQHNSGPIGTSTQPSQATKATQQAAQFRGSKSVSIIQATTQHTIQRMEEQHNYKRKFFTKGTSGQLEQYQSLEIGMADLHNEVNQPI